MLQPQSRIFSRRALFCLKFCFYFGLGFAYLGSTSVLRAQASDGQESNSLHPQNPENQLEESINREWFLALEKSGAIKRIRFYTGDEIHLQLVGDKTEYSPTITKIEENAIFSYGARIPLEDIRVVVIHRDEWFLKQGSIYLPLAGVGYFLMDLMNPIFSEEQEVNISGSTILTSSAFILGGVILHFLKKRKHRLGNRKYLRTLVKF